MDQDPEDLTALAGIEAVLHADVDGRDQLPNLHLTPWIGVTAEVVLPFLQRRWIGVRDGLPDQAQALTVSFREQRMPDDLLCLFGVYPHPSEALNMRADQIRTQLS